jgi:hypothetical protein
VTTSKIVDGLAENVFMEFIATFKKVDEIILIMDRFNKMVHFIPIVDKTTT